MNSPLHYRNARYYNYAYMRGESGAAIYADLQNRQTFVTSTKLKLDKTCGVNVPLGDQSVLFIIDTRTIAHDGEVWHKIASIAAHLANIWPQLNDDAKLALKSLYAVAFTSIPNRAYADVLRKTFVYAVDEFRDTDGGLISDAYAVSNIIHDANHIHQFHAKQDFSGPEAEQACWKLQIDNAAALGLAAYEVDFLNELIETPTLVDARLDSDPYGRKVSQV